MERKTRRTRKPTITNNILNAMGVYKFLGWGTRMTPTPLYKYLRWGKGKIVPQVSLKGHSHVKYIVSLYTNV
jgi:hypothetical protein